MSFQRGTLHLSKPPCDVDLCSEVVRHQRFGTPGPLVNQGIQSVARVGKLWEVLRPQQLQSASCSNQHPAFVKTVHHLLSPSPFSRHWRCTICVPESRRTLLSHPGAPSLGLISVLGWVSFVRSLHFGFGPSPRLRQEPPTFFASAMSCFVPCWHEPDCGLAEHCFLRASVGSGHCHTSRFLSSTVYIKICCCEGFHPFPNTLVLSLSLHRVEVRLSALSHAMSALSAVETLSLESLCLFAFD